MKTVAETSPTNALPHALVSDFLAAARPSKKTSEEPETIGFVPCPGKGHAVGSVMRAAGFAISDSFLVALNEGSNVPPGVSKGSRKTAHGGIQTKNPALGRVPLFSFTSIIIGLTNSPSLFPSTIRERMPTLAQYAGYSPDLPQTPLCTT
jgi:hypothetical protein